jgi:hypothetical protein
MTTSDAPAMSATIVGTHSVEDRASIIETCTNMAWCIDERRWDDLGLLFADHVRIDYSDIFGGSAQDITPADMVRTSQRLLGNLNATQHLVASHVVEGTGDTARCRSMVQASHFLPNRSGGPMWTVGAQYHMDLVRMPGGWRISGIRVVMSWATGNRDVMRLGKSLPST